MEATSDDFRPTKVRLDKKATVRTIVEETSDENCLSCE